MELSAYNLDLVKDEDHECTHAPALRPDLLRLLSKRVSSHHRPYPDSEQGALRSLAHTVHAAANVKRRCADIGMSVQGQSVFNKHTNIGATVQEGDPPASTNKLLSCAEVRVGMQVHTISGTDQARLHDEAVTYLWRMRAPSGSDSEKGEWQGQTKKRPSNQVQLLPAHGNFA